jgi:acetoin utilization protein AcuB
MFVADWMMRQVVTVVPDDSVARAMHLMLERGIKHLPVVHDGAVVGVISDRDIRAYTPAKAKVKDAMGARLTTTTPDTPIEAAALLLHENAIGCLPVVEGDVLVGIISDRDIFRALVDITGVRHGGHRVCVTVTDRPGSIREVTDIIRGHGFRLHGILTSYEKVPQGLRSVVIRTGLEGDFEAMRADLEKKYSSVRINKG